MTSIKRDEQPVGRPPATKVPSLDTSDHYLASSAEHSKGFVQATDIPGYLEVSNEKILLETYARFVSGLTGADEVAFILARDTSPDTLSVAMVVVSAVVHRSAQQEDESVLVKWDELDMSFSRENEIQFALDLRMSSFGDNYILERHDLFLLSIGPSAVVNKAVASISYPSQHITEPVAAQLLKVFISQIFPGVESLYDSCPRFSLVNHPPLFYPPVQFSSDWDVATSATHLHAGFEHWASISPDTPALDFFSSISSQERPALHQVLSYGMINNAANRVASLLLELVSQEAVAAGRCIVPVHMSTSPELYISYLAILKAGLAFSPLPTDAPLERIYELLEDIAPPIVLGIGGKPDVWASQGIQTPWIDVTEVSRWNLLSNQRTSSEDTGCTFQPPPIANNALAYLLFTSGSTGKPKGVQVSHSSATCSIASHSTAISLPDRNDGGFRWFQFAAPTFDPSIMEIFVTLSNGGTLCAAPRALTLTDLEGSINEAQATIMMATPSLAALLRPSHLQTLKSLWCMGEKLNRTVIDNFGTRSPDNTYTLANFYGPTEAAINCTVLSPVEYSVRGSIIGEALPTCSMFILDHESQVPKLVPAGFAGELAIGGPQVSEGYMGRPEETTRAYVYSEEYGRLYRTGDMARIVWDKSGRQLIEFLGRISLDQVKLSGRRVELGEIESVLSTVSGVTELVATIAKAAGGREGSEHIVACIVANVQSSVERQKLVDSCCQKCDSFLPSYMRPSRYTFLDSLPRSSSGKVDRKKVHSEILASVVSQSFSASSENQCLLATEDELESNCEALQRPTLTLLMAAIGETVGEASSAISPEMSLASAGLDSLGAVRLLQKLRDHSIAGLEVGDVLQCGTIKALIAKVALTTRSQDSITKGAENEVELQRALGAFAERNLPGCAEQLGVHEDQIQSVLPTTATQSGMLASFLRSSNKPPGSTPAYVYHSVMPVRDGIDIGRLKRAWDIVTSSYDSFRTVFCPVDDDMSPFAQCILKARDDFTEPTWSTYSHGLGHDDYNIAVKLACRNAEANIDIGSNPSHISLISSETQSTVVLSMFHGIFDGGSLQILLQDVTEAYEGKSLPKRTSLQHVVYHHFSVDPKATTLFWNKHLEGHSPVAFPSLTPFRPLSSIKTHMIEVSSLIGHRELKTACKSMGVTPLSVLQAAWASILLAYSGTSEQDVVIGSVVSGRLDPRTENCIGPTFTTVPIRLTQEDHYHGRAEWTNRSVAESLASSNAAALSHLQPRLGSVVTADGRLPYDTLLAYQDFNVGSESEGIWTSIHHPPMANDFKVMVEVWPGHDSRLLLRATFNDECMDCEAAELMLREMSYIISNILKNPDESFSGNSFIGDSSLRSCIYPAQPQEFAPNTLLHSQFEAHAVSNPDDHALIFRGNLLDEDSPANICWTYADLNAKAQSLADHMVSILGPLTGTVVPVHIEKSPALYVAILGTLKAGAAWCPIDVFSPAQRRQELIVRTERQLVLVSSADSTGMEGALPDGVIPIDVLPFTRKSKYDVNFQANEPRNTDPTKVAYMIWTSGTTGAPKGVPINHSSAYTAINALIEAIPGTRDGQPVRCLQFSQPTFDVSIQDLFFTWSSGGVLISAPREVMLGSFAELANVTGATHAHLTPTFSAGLQRAGFKTLQTITMIGEKLLQPVADDWGQNMRAFNTYGPAEATIVSTLREFGNEHKSVKSGNIGWPLKSVSVFVTRERKLVMKHAVGELALGGPQLSPGYLKQPETNKQKYVWNGEVNEVLYYTGDLVRMLSDGSLEYISRTDDLVKLGGIRVELGEISFSLRHCHPLAEGIETMVLNRHDRPNDAVVAFIAAPQAVNPGQEVPTILLNDTAISIARAAIREASMTLPDHMKPSTFVVVPSIPKTQSAKADRRALQALYTDLDVDGWDKACNVPTEDLKGPAVEIDCEVKDSVMQNISLLSNIESTSFTESSRLRSLGIDSIRAIRLASRLNEAGYRLPVVDVLQCETVRDLALLAGSGSKASQAKNLLDLEEFNRKWHRQVSALIPGGFFVCPAKTIQEGFLSETLTTSAMYWSHHSFTLHSDVDIGKLKRAWQIVCRSNEALRACFLPVAALQKQAYGYENGTDILQIIHDQHIVDWEYIESTNKSLGQDLNQRIVALQDRHQSSYFQHPPWAVTIMDNHVERTMVLSIHHVLYDGQALGYIMNDVYCAYGADAPIRPQLRDALSLVLPSKKASLDTQMFWEQELCDDAGSDVPSWPNLTGERTIPEQEKDRRFITETVRLSVRPAQLETMAAELDVSSVASIVRVAFGHVLLSYLGSPGVVFAETLSDRVLGADIDRTIGPFISVVPVPFNSNGTVREVLAEQHRLSTQARKHRHIHAQTIRKLLRKERGEPLYPGVFTFHASNEVDLMTAPSGTLWNTKSNDFGLIVEHPMALNVFREPDGTVVLEASSLNTIMSSAQLAIFIRQIDALIGAMLNNPDLPLRSLPSSIEKDLLSISAPSPSDAVRESTNSSPVRWIESTAEQHPEWTAVEETLSITEAGIEQFFMSYGELNASANRVAAYLSHIGIKNRAVALCSRRNLASYPVLVGIVKSGNAYLPIDEGLPDDRKAFLIKDGDAPVVFTETAFFSTFEGVPSQCRIVCIDERSFQQDLLAFSSENQTYLANPHDTAYILYTSGSTGKPKGVMITRANLSSFIESLSEFVCRIAPVTRELGGKGRWLGQASRAFDPHIAEMFFPWRHGMATSTGARSLLMDDLRLTLAKLEITHAGFVPSLLDQADIRPQDCPSLVLLSVGGEKISQRVLDTWGCASQVAIMNAYGPTELTVGCSFAPVHKHSTPRNIGLPLTSCACHVLLPDTLDYALRGQTGELCFTGDLVGKGYLNRPDAKGFVIGPDQEKMYRTGDVGRIMADGSIEYLGRGDDQTKIRGQRLELGEVSEVIRTSSQASIDVVTIIAKHPGLARQQLVSFIARLEHQRCTAKDDLSIIPADISTFCKDLRDICRQKLPSYMVPDIVLPVNRIPFAAMSDKVNSKLLQELFASIPLSEILRGNQTTHSDVKEVRELTMEEEVIADAICHTLAIDRSMIHPHTNIFEIGIDSLSAINLSIHLRHIGLPASVALVMSNPVVEQLAHLSCKSNLSSEAVSSSEIQQSRLSKLEELFDTGLFKIDGLSVASVRPCLPLQEGLVARSMNSNSGLYVNHIALKMNTATDATRLQNAWQETVKETEILRTVFVPLQSEIAQAVLDPDCRCDWTEAQYDDLEMAMTDFQSRQEAIGRNITRNMVSIPPLRILHAVTTVSRLPLALFISIHHSLYDGASLGMLLQDFAARYLPDMAPPQRGSPETFIKEVCSQNIYNSESFWCQKLAGCKPTIFKKPVSGLDPHVHSQKLSPSLPDLESCAARMKSTLSSLVQAVFALTLADAVSTSDVTYGVVLSGRAFPVAGADTVLLPCIATVPARLNLEGLSSMEDVIQHVHKGTAEALDHQHTSLRHIQRWIKAEGAIFDCLFSFTKSAEVQSHDLWEEMESNMPSEYPLALEVEADKKNKCAFLTCGFTSAFGQTDDAQDLMAKMDLILSAMVSNPSISLDSLNLSWSSATPTTDTKKDWEDRPWSNLEVEICELVKRFCGLKGEQISRNASFFSLGLDSVTAIRFSSQLRDAGVSVSSAEVMSFSCIGALAHRVVEKAASEVPSPPLSNFDDDTQLDGFISEVERLSPNDSIESVFKCSPLQTAMITETIESNGIAYVHPHIVRLQDTTSVDRLKEAYRLVVMANDILRTSFHPVPEMEMDFSWFGAIHSDSPATWLETTVPSGTNMAQAVMQLLRLDTQSAFSTPPIRPVIVSESGQRLLVIIMHHALYDGVSLPFIFDDLALAYQGASLPIRPPFATIVRSLSQDQTEACQFWADTFEGFEATPLPRSPHRQPSSGMFYSEAKIDLDMTDILENCKEMEVTVQSVAILAYAKVLAKLSGKRDVAFGQVLAGRSSLGLGAEQVVGPLFNTVAKRVTLDPTFISNRNKVQMIQKLTTEAQHHEHAPLHDVQKSLRSKGILRGATLVDTLFVFQNSVRTLRDDLADSKIWMPYITDDYVPKSEYKMNTEVEQTDKAITVRASCQGEVMAQQDLDQALRDFNQAFSDIVKHPLRCVTIFPDELQSLPLSFGSSADSAVLAAGSPAPSHENIIRDILSQVSRVPGESIQPDTNIFSIGLDSLSAIRVASLCRAAGFKAGVSDVLQGHTLRGISLRVQALPQEKNDRKSLMKDYSSVKKDIVDRLGLRPNAIDKILPCLGGQMYHLASWLQTGRALFEPAWPFSCSERIDVEIMKDAWFLLRQNNPILRTCFYSISPSEVVQVVLAGCDRDDGTFQVATSTGTLEDLAISQAQEAALKPSSLETPPVRLILLKAGDRDGIHILMNHAIYDAWTMPLLIDELTGHYRGVSPASRPDFSSFIEFTLESLAEMDEPSYWRSAVGHSASTLINPSVSGKAKDNNQLFVGAWEAIKDFGHLDGVCRSSNVTFQSIVILAVARILAQDTGLPSPTLGLYQTGRSASFDDIDRLTGPCLNVTPLTVQDALPKGDAESIQVAEKAQSIQAALAERLPYEQSSLSDILSPWKEGAGDTSLHLFNVWLNLLWMQPMSRATEVDPKSDQSKTLLEHLPIGVPTDFMPPEHFSHSNSSATSISNLDISYLPEENIYIDVAPDILTDTIGFGVRVQGGLMDEVETRVFVERIGREILILVKEME
uniref:Ferrirhodin synthetase n=1 Tax=Gibberella sacchari TaxID=42676 RepID=H9BDI0_GIBSA|nr:ferrirhodin synthetase [Fusarium sacchari]